MKILLNPKDGAIIKDFSYQWNKYFTTGEEFTPGKIIKMEDDVADAVVSTFGFVQVVTENEAKKELDNKNKEEFRCEKCDFKTTNKGALTGHERSHIDSETLDSIPTVKKKEVLKADDTKTTEEKWEQEDKAAGLEGEGLVNESPRKSVKMS